MGFGLVPGRMGRRSLKIKRRGLWASFTQDRVDL